MEVKIKSCWKTNILSKYSKEQLEKEYVTGYELINECPNKPYIDIELEKDIKFVYEYYNKIKCILDNNNINEYLIFNGSRYIFKGTNRIYKISFHVIILDLMLHCGICTMIYIYNLFRNHLIDIKIDSNVYKSIDKQQLFRLPYTLKDSKDSNLCLINTKDTLINRDIITYDKPTHYLDYYVTLNNRNTNIIRYCNDYNSKNKNKILNCKFKIVNNKVIFEEVSKEELKYTLNNIPIKYLENYNTWMPIMFAIKNTSDNNGYDALDLAYDISIKAKGYEDLDRNDIIKLYNSYDSDRSPTYHKLLEYTKENKNFIFKDKISYTVNNDKDIKQSDIVKLFENIKNKNINGVVYEKTDGLVNGHFKIEQKSKYNLVISCLFVINSILKTKSFTAFDSSKKVSETEYNNSLYIIDKNKIFNNKKCVEKYYTELFKNISMINLNKDIYKENYKHRMPYSQKKNESYENVIKEMDLDKSMQLNQVIHKDFDINRCNEYVTTFININNVNIENLNIIINDTKDITSIFEDDLILYNNEELECGSLKDIDNIFKMYKFKNLQDVKLVIKKYISKVIKYSLDDKWYIINKVNDEYVLMEKLPIFEIYVDSFDGLETYELHKILYNRHLIESYNACTFKPYYNTKDNFNMWKGIKANKDNICNISSDTENIINFIKEVWCCNNISYFNYIITWFKKVICEGKKTKKCIVLYSNKQQVGKGIIINWIIKYVIGKIHSKQITGIDALVSRFNQDLMNKILINVDELSSIEKYGYSAAYDVIKNKITEPYINIEIKGGRKFSYPDYSNYIFTTNHTNSIKIEENDKRYVVFNVSDKYYNDHEFFKTLKLNQDTANEFYYYLSNFNDEVDILQNLTNELRDDIIDISLTSTQLFLKYLKNKKINISTSVRDDDNNYITSKHLFDYYIEWCNQNNEKNKQKHQMFTIECKQVLNIKRIDNIRYFVMPT